MSASVEQELIDLERQYWQAMKDGDAQACGRLADDRRSSRARPACRRSIARRS